MAHLFSHEKGVGGGGGGGGGGGTKLDISFWNLLFLKKYSNMENTLTVLPQLAGVV